MKNKLQSSGILLRLVLVFAVMAGIGQRTLGAVAFSVTPAAISNTYFGPVTFLVTGLTNMETVVVQKYLDVNGDGMVDAGDRLWQQFTLTDGVNFKIGGVTNLNVPGDLDTTGGQITARLYPQADFLQVMAANYLFVLSSPVGHFTPITNSFAVTSFPFAQKFTGTVASNGVAVPYASIILFPASGDGNGPGNPVGATMANGSGVYTLPAPGGTYTLAAFKTNFLASLAGAASLVLTNGTTFSTNLSMVAATSTISGQMVDASTYNGLPGLAFAATSKNGLLGISTSDTNGNFTVGVTTNQWGLSMLNAGVALHGYARPQNKTSANTVTGSVAGLSLTFTKGTAFVYGTVKDNLGHALGGEVAVYAQDNGSGLYESDGYTDTNGNYVAVVVGGLGSTDPWNVSVDNTTSFPNDIFSQPAFNQNPYGGTNIAAGTIVPANITALTATNYITGNVSFNGTNVVGVGVNAYTTINGASFGLNTVDTDSHGNYSFAVANGSWTVSVDDCGCSQSDSLNNIVMNYQDPPSDNVTINNNNGTANFTVPSGGSGQIFGYVTDTYGDPVGGVNVYANNGGGVNYSTTTDGSGYYSFNVSSGTWDVSVDCGGLMDDGYECVSDENVSISSGSVQQNFVVTSGSGTLGITTSTLADGISGGAYSQTLAAAGGFSPYSWSLTPGSLSLPGGLGISTSGIISGTPSSVPFGGLTNYFSVRVTDSEDNTEDQLLSITVYPALSMPASALPNGTNGKSYNAQIEVSGGDNIGSGSYYYPTYNFSGTFPPGLSFSAGATTVSNEIFLISGTPSNSGTFSFTFYVYDQDGNEVQNNFSITLASASVQITTTSLTNATAGIGYTNQLLGSGGTLPYTWTIANGSQALPSGLGLSASGLLSGIPAAGGTNSFIVRLTDHNSLTTTHSYTLITNPKPALGAGVITNGTQFQFFLNGASGQNYTLQRSTNLSSTNWLTLFVTNNPATNKFMVTDPNATNKQGYYRVLIGP